MLFKLFSSMKLGLFKNADGCMLDLSKVVHVRVYHGTATFLESEHHRFSSQILHIHHTYPHLTTLLNFTRHDKHAHELLHKDNGMLLKSCSSQTLHVHHACPWHVTNPSQI